MGRDKAWLPAEDGGPLWLRQWRLLECVGAPERLLACRADQEFPADIPRVIDRWPDAGPMGAVVGCLEAMRHSLLLVLAVDLPRMSAEVLDRLLAASSEGCGAVFVRDGFFEPLAAVYPATMAAEGARVLESGGRSLQPWIRAALEAGNMTALPCDAAAAAAFTNWNSPEDLSGKDG